MYWPCSLRAARRADDSLSFRPGPDGFREWWVAAVSTGARRPSTREIVASDLRIARTSLLTDRRRVLRKRTSKAETPAESYYSAPAPPPAREGRSCACSTRGRLRAAPRATRLRGAETGDDERRSHRLNSPHLEIPRGPCWTSGGTIQRRTRATLEGNARRFAGDGGSLALVSGGSIPSQAVPPTPLTPMCYPASVGWANLGNSSPLLLGG